MWSFIKILIFIALPVGIGFGLGIVLRNLYQQEYPEGEEIPEEPETEQTSPVSVPPAEEASTSPEEAVEASDVEIPEEPSPEAERVDESPEEPQEEAHREIAKSKDDPFDDHGLLPRSFKVEEVLEDMLDENNTDVPEDLSARIDEDRISADNSFAQPDEDIDSFDPMDVDDDILARAMEHLQNPTGQDPGESTAEPIDFTTEGGDSSSEISPMAVELLGEDFNFDSLTESSLKTEMPDPEEVREEQTVDAEESALLATESQFIAEESAPEISDTEITETIIAPLDSLSTPVDIRVGDIREVGEGIYQADSIVSTDGPHDPPEHHDIVTVFPEDMVRTDVIEPDRSEAARRYEIVEMSQPMLMKKTKRT